MAKHPSMRNTCSASESSIDVKKRLIQPTITDFLPLKAQKGISKSKGVRNQKKKWEAFDLSSLLESLPVSKAARQHTCTSFELNGKSRKRQVLNGRKVEVVLCHPAFPSDRLAAMHQHLQDNSTQTRTKHEKRKLMKAMKKCHLRQERQERTHTSEGKLLESMGEICLQLERAYIE